MSETDQFLHTCKAVPLAAFGSPWPDQCPISDIFDFGQCSLAASAENFFPSACPGNEVAMRERTAQ